MCFKVPRCLSKARRAPTPPGSEKHEMMNEKHASLEDEDDEEKPPPHGARKCDRKRQSRSDSFRRMAYQHRHDLPIAAAAGSPSPPPSFALLGDNARDQVLAVLLDSTATQLDNLECEANHKIHGLWMLNRGGKPLSKAEFELHVEFVVAEFREAKGEIYKKLAWEHGEMRANEVFGMLKVNDRLPKDYLQILAENENYPEQVYLLELLEDMSNAKEKSDAAQEKWDVVDWDGETRLERGGETRVERGGNGPEAQVDWGDDDLEIHVDRGEGTSEAHVNGGEDDFEDLVVVSSSSTL